MVEKKHQNLEDVVMYKILNLKNVKFIFGNSTIYDISLLPFCDLIIDFVSELSKILTNKNNSKKFPDIVSLAFWCRKKNLMRFNSENNEKARGLIFHITPSNIPTNFAYSLLFGLLNGNANIVKVSSKEFEQVKIFSNALKLLVKKKKFEIFKKMIKIVRYENNEKFTQEISLKSDARLIWGSDQTIEKIKSFKTKINTIDIVFSDRYSFSIFDIKKISKLNEYDYKIFIKNFYNDTYSVDQDACSSPHLIFWLNKNDKAKKAFWTEVFKYAKENYDNSGSLINEKNILNHQNLMKLKKIKKILNFENFLNVISLKNIELPLDEYRGKMGYFFEYDIKDIKETLKFINQKCQTITYYGIEKKNFINLIKQLNKKGIDRIVPIGQALNINLIWDGFEINKILRRKINLS